MSQQHDGPRRRRAAGGAALLAWAVAVAAGCVGIAGPEAQQSEPSVDETASAVPMAHSSDDAEVDGGDAEADAAGPSPDGGTGDLADSGTSEEPDASADGGNTGGGGGCGCGRGCSVWVSWTTDGVPSGHSYADDLDGDGVANNVDNCPNTVNRSQSDADEDGIGDACETDGG